MIAAESLVFVANGFRCPLTDVAESLGAEHGSVTDIYLPAWFARNCRQSMFRSLLWHCSSTDGISGDRFGQHR